MRCSFQKVSVIPYIFLYKWGCCTETQGEKIIKECQQITCHVKPYSKQIIAISHNKPAETPFEKSESTPICTLEKLVLEPEKSLSLPKGPSAPDASRQNVLKAASTAASSKSQDKGLFRRCRAHYVISGTLSRTGRGEKGLKKHLHGPRWLRQRDASCQLGRIGATFPYETLLKREVARDRGGIGKRGLWPCLSFSPGVNHTSFKLIRVVGFGLSQIKQLDDTVIVAWAHL